MAPSRASSASNLSVLQFRTSVKPSQTSNSDNGYAPLPDQLEAHDDTRGNLLTLLHFPLRGTILFLLGALFAVLVNHVLIQRHVTTFPQQGAKVETAAWIPVWAGIGGVIVGTLHPVLDYWIHRKPHAMAREWANVMRCCGAFFGLAYAGSSFSGAWLSLSLAMQAIGMWYVFDRTVQGLGVGAAVAVIGTLVIRWLIASELLVFTQPDFWFMRSWVPIMLFSVSTSFGAIGRKLDIVPVEMWDHDA